MGGSGFSIVVLEDVFSAREGAPPRRIVASSLKSLLIVTVDDGMLRLSVARRRLERSVMSFSSRKSLSNIFVFGGWSKVTPSSFASYIAQ